MSSIIGLPATRSRLCAFIPHLWFARNASGAKTHVFHIDSERFSRTRRPDTRACNIVLHSCGGNFNSPLNLFISFAKALMEQGFRSDLFLAKDIHDKDLSRENTHLLGLIGRISGEATVAGVTVCTDLPNWIR